MDNYEDKIEIYNENSNMNYNNIQNEVQISPKIDYSKVLGDISNIYSTIGLFSALLVALSIIISYIRYKKILRKKSKDVYDNNVRNKKYIENIYVEIGETTEKARYTINGKKWKKRIEHNLKGILTKNTKKIIDDVYHIDEKDISQEINDYCSLLKFLDEKRGIECEKQNEIYYLYHNSYYYSKEIKLLKEKNDSMNTNILFIVGKAGSGKTNLATYLAKLINEKYKNYCIYINAKDIIEGVEEAFYKYFYTKILFTKDDKKRIDIFLKILSIFNRKIFIIIEAINESDKEDFIDNLTDFINDNYKKNIYFIITVRSEFFELKYRKTIEEKMVNKYKIIEMDEIRVNENIKNQMMQKYREYYNFKGKYNNRVKMIIEESPILTRIFFESYKDTDEEVNDINKYTLLKNYINNIDEKEKNIDVFKLLEKITSQMLENKEYNYIKIEDLNVPKEDIYKLVNEHVILSNSIIKKENTLEEEVEEIIMFTFDELRDYLLARNIVMNYNEKAILSFIIKIIAEKSPIAEGTIRNIYLNYKISGNKNMCKKILELDIDNIGANYMFRKNNEFDGYVVDIIIQNGIGLFDFEIEYLNNCKITADDVIKIIFKLLANERVNLQPDFSYISEEIEKCKLDKTKNSFLKKVSRQQYEQLMSKLEENSSEDTKEFSKIIEKILEVIYG